MTALSTTTNRASLTEAAGAASQLRQRLNQSAYDGPTSADARACLAMLDTAASAYATGAGWDQHSHATLHAYALTFNTGGSNDAQTKTALMTWLNGSPTLPACGLAYGSVAGSIAPRLGAALKTLFT